MNPTYIYESTTVNDTIDVSPFDTMITEALTQICK